MDVRHKEPSESLDYGIDWTPNLAAGETVTTAAFTATPAGLTMGAAANTTTLSTVRISGGTAGVEYEVQGSVTTSNGNTLVESFILSVVDEPATVTGERYCTVAQARAQGAQGSTRDVEAAIVAATHRVDTYTGERFTPRLMTVVARVGGDGRAMLPHRLTTVEGVTEVVDHDNAALLNLGTFRAYSSATSGDVDAIGLGRRHVGTNILVNGLESYAPLSTFGVERVRVTATFGYATTPDVVAQATAMLAAALARSTTATSTATANGTDPEGNVIPVVPPFQAEEADLPVAQAQRTTGSRYVDALLMPYRRTLTLTGV